MKNLFLILGIVFTFSNLLAQKNESFYNKGFDSPKTIQEVKYNALMDNYDVVFYFLNLNVINTSKTISGSGSVKAKVVANSLNEIVLELHSSLTVDSLWLDSSLHNYTRTGNEIHILPSTPFSLNDYFFVTVFYHGSSTGGGIKTGTSGFWQKQATWTLSESYHALDWFPCKQSLTDKADSAWMYFTCNNNLKVGSNGILTQVSPVGSTKSRYEWKTKYPIDYYLISLAVSEYQEYNLYAHPAAITDSILIQNYLYNNPALLPQFKTTIDLTDDFIELLSEKWGLYPFWEEKYGHSMAPFSGGMEHQTMTSLGFFDFNLVVHELAHQWFGDYVTCATWQDIWVNEGFATYSYYIGAENLLTQTEADDWMLEVHTDVMSEPDGSLFVPFAEVMDENRIFDYRLTYQKGAAILHSMRYIVNDDNLYWSAYRNFLQQYSFGTATADQFKSVLANTTSINFDSFFDEWFYGEGYPTYSVNAVTANDSIYLTLSQTTSMSSVTPLFTNPIDIRFNYDGGSITKRITPNIQNYTYKFEFPYTLTTVEIDPDNYIINKDGNIVITSNPENLVPVVSVYPNPVNQFIQWQSFTDFLEYQITDVSGKIVDKGSSNPSIRQLNIDKLNNGIYYIEFSNLKSRISKKILKL